LVFVVIVEMNIPQNIVKLTWFFINGKIG
jgi:hypothetical protein